MAAFSSKQQRQCGHLYDDLWLEMFMRLPVKSLCKFRCVCKSWNSLFTSGSFIALHHHYSTTSLSAKANHKSYFPLESYAPPTFLTRHHDLDRQDEPRIFQHATYLRSPSRDEGQHHHQRLVVIGVTRGIVCLATETPIARNTRFNSSAAILWNPATRKHITIKFQPYGDCPFDLGFCYDSVKSDFKLVMTALPWYNVFSVEQGCWRESRAVNAELKGYKTRPTCGVCYTNGRVHWIARSGGNPHAFHLSTEEAFTFVLLLFDCESEQFRMMDFPQQLLPNGPQDSRMCDLAQLFEYCGMLSVLKETFNRSNRYELWVMEEHGVVSSWKKLFRIDHRPCVTNEMLVILGRDGLPSDPAGVEGLDLNLYDVRPLDFFRMDRPQPLNSQGFVESLFLMDVDLEQNRTSGDNKGDHPNQTRAGDANFYLGCMYRRLSYSTYACLSNLLRRATNWY